MPREVIRYSNCFVCGPNNPIGLNLKFLSEGNRAWTVFTPDDRHEGYKGLIHGGIIATVLDEVMIKAALAQGIFCVTASMEVRYKAPANLGSKFYFEACVTGVRGRIIDASGKMAEDSGKLIAEASARYMTVSDEMKKQLNESVSE